MRIALAGAGAFGEKHLDGLKNIDGVEIVSIISRTGEQAAAVAAKYGARHSSTELADALAREDVDAVILCTPTQMHASQAIACMEAGKHVQVEIPLSDSWADAEAVTAKQRETGLVCMVGHTRRFNPSHQWVHNRIVGGELTIQQMDVQTYFFRRQNINAKGEPRTGRPADTGVVQVTAVARTCLQAEVRAKTALLAGPAQAAGALSGGGVWVDDERAVHVVSAQQVATTCT
jgi:2-hydroxy-4-carboxymuconate semialdehyde hemiacetal dehydrogenase